MAKKYEVYNQDLKRVFSYSYIGCNHTANNMKFGGYISSYGDILDKDDLVGIQTGLDDIRIAQLGDIDEAYNILKKVLYERKPDSFSQICECIFETVNLYFGNYSSVDKRLSYFPTEDDVAYDGLSRGTLSSIAHKNAAICIERSMLSQNLLKTLGINSYIKIAGFINNDGFQDVHAFNLVESEEVYYIFDATQPTLKEGIINPLVAEIPKEVFDKMIIPVGNFGVSVHVKHYNPLTNKDYDVTYDAGRSDTYDASKNYIK